MPVRYFLKNKNNSYHYKFSTHHSSHAFVNDFITFTKIIELYFPNE